MKIKIKFQDKEIEAELNETGTAKKIYENLPIKSKINLWGEEIYFEIPVSMDLEEPAKQDMDIGDLAYWPEGQAFCIFFGKTPVSINGKPKAISFVTLIGKAEKIGIFKKVKDREKIIVDKLEEKQENE